MKLTDLFGGDDRPPFLTIEAGVRCVHCNEVLHTETIDTGEGIEHAIPVDVCDCQERTRTERVGSGLFTPGRLRERTVRDPAPKHVTIEVTNVEVFE